MNDNIKKAQEALFAWICVQRKVNYQSIKKFCDYLNLQYNLLLDEHPAWKIFLPLFNAGNIDFCGYGNFKITEPVAIMKGNVCIYTNIFNQPIEVQTTFPFIFRKEGKVDFEFRKIYRFNAISILKNFPTIGDVVGGFTSLALNDFSLLDFENKSTNFGVAKRVDCNFNYYFVYPNTRRIVSIPIWEESPESINISYCYARSLDKRGNGYYQLKTKTLYIDSFHFPVLLYRVLLLESLFKGYMPYYKNRKYIFQGIDIKIASEIDRILNKSLKYE